MHMKMNEIFSHTNNSKINNGTKIVKRCAGLGHTSQIYYLTNLYLFKNEIAFWAFRSVNP